MATVVITPAAQVEADATPVVIQRRIAPVIERLQKWPTVSGAKPLRGDLQGSFRIRTGDYRVVFRVAGETVTIWKVGYRGAVYD